MDGAELPPTRQPPLEWLLAEPVRWETYLAGMQRAYEHAAEERDAAFEAGYARANQEWTNVNTTGAAQAYRAGAGGRTRADLDADQASRWVERPGQTADEILTRAAESWDLVEGGEDDAAGAA